jgi:uncharacterized membrane protein
MMVGMRSSLSAAPSASSGARTNAMILGILALVGVISFFVFFWPEHVRKQILRTGVRAQAVVLAIEPTGAIINNQPQVQLTLQVQATEMKVYRAKVKMVVNQVYLSEFQPGHILQVHYDPKDPSRVAVDESGS